jgi:hypothetical protein
MVETTDGNIAHLPKSDRAAKDAEPDQAALEELSGLFADPQGEERRRCVGQRWQPTCACLYSSHFHVNIA